LGLHPFPGDLKLDGIIGNKLIEKIHTIAKELPSLSGPRQLSEAIFNRVEQEMRIPTEDGRRQVRYAISHFITTTLYNGRGGVCFVSDRVIDEREYEGIINIDLSNRLSDWLVSAPCNAPPGSNETTAAGESRDLGGFVLDGCALDQLSKMNEEALKQLTVLVGTQSQTKQMEIQAHERIKMEEMCLQRLRIQADERRNDEDREEVGRQRLQRLEEIRLQTEADRIRAQAELLRTQRGEKRAATEPAEHVPKRPRVALSADGPRNLRNRYSVSHRVWDRVSAAGLVADVELPDVFRMVDEWVVERLRRKSRPLDLMRVVVDGTPVLYAHPITHKNRFEGTAAETELGQHVERLLRPAAAVAETPAADAPLDEDAPPEDVPEPSVSSSSRPTLAPCFLPAPTSPPPELQPIPLEQQREDIVRLATLVDADPRRWPCPAQEMPAVPRNLWRAWSTIPVAKGMRVSQLMCATGWTGPLDYLLLTVVATKLDGWCWSNHRRLYPKAAAQCFRRAAWVLRDVGWMQKKIQDALGLRKP